MNAGATLVVQTFGTVISGEYAGDIAEQTSVFPASALQACSTPQGLTALNGTTTLILSTV